MTVFLDIAQYVLCAIQPVSHNFILQLEFLSQEFHFAFPSSECFKYIYYICIYVLEFIGTVTFELFV